MKSFRNRWLAAAMLSVLVSFSAAQVFAIPGGPSPREYADIGGPTVQLGDPDDWGGGRAREAPESVWVDFISVVLLRGSPLSIRSHRLVAPLVGRATPTALRGTRSRE